MSQHGKLILGNGLPQYGLFDHPVDDINVEDFDYRTTMDKPANRLAKHFHFNQFQFIGVLTDELIVGCAIADLKYLSNAFVYLYDRQTGQFEDVSLLQPLGWNTRLSTRPNLGKSYFHRGRDRFDIEAHGAQRLLKVALRRGIKLDLQLAEPDPLQPLRICTRTGYNGWAYTQKATALPVAGAIDWQGRHYPIDAQSSSANYDWSCGYMRRETAWNWGSLSGFLADGRRVGLNLAAGVNETGFTENGFWVDGKLHKVGSVAFDFARRDRLQPWQMRSDDDRVALRFEPEGQRSERINAFVMASNFTQLFGRYHGTLRTEQGETLILDGQPGFAEDHYAKW